MSFRRSIPDAQKAQKLVLYTDAANMGGSMPPDGPDLKTDEDVVRSHTPHYYKTYRPPYSEPTTLSGRPGTWKQRVLDPKFLAAIHRNISKSMRRNLTEAEQHHLRNFINGINPVPFESMDDTDLVPLISKQFLTGLFRPGRGSFRPDMHEVLKFEIEKDDAEDNENRSRFDKVNRKLNKIGPDVQSTHIGSIIGSQSTYDLLTMFNPKALVSEQRIEMDSKYRIYGGPADNVIYKWGINYGSQRSQGALNILGSKIVNVVGFEIFPFSIPIPVNAQATTRPNNQFRLLIQEWANQAFAAPSNISYHCIFAATRDTSVTPNYINLNPIGDKDQGGSISFDKKITRFDQISILLYNPVIPCIFQRDRYTSTVTPGASTLFQTDAAHSLTTNDVISISGFDTDNPNNDATAIGRLNDPTATWQIASTPAADTFTISYDTSAMVGTPTSCMVFIETRRMFLQMKIKFVSSASSYP